MKKLKLLFIGCMLSFCVVLLGVGVAVADETCMSPYMAKIVGQEDFIYVWTLGVDGVGDEQDKLVTVDVRPNSATYGKVISTLSVGGQNEAHHSGLSDDRLYLWAGGLDTSKIFIFDVHTDPATPKLHKRIDNFVEQTGGLVGPHTFYAMPGRIMVSALSNSKNHGGVTGMAEYTNDGQYIITHWNPVDGDMRGSVKIGGDFVADGYGYDVRALPRLNVMVTSSFTGFDNYMMDFTELAKNKEALRHFGNNMVLWNLHTRKPEKVFEVPGAPLEVRCAWGPNHNYCFTVTALTSKIWVIHEDAETGIWGASIGGTVGKEGEFLLPVDISLTSDDKGMWVQTFMDGKTHYFDVSDPFDVKEVYKYKIGTQVNMVSQSWDGKRVYFTSSLLSKWDKIGASDEQWLKGYEWDGEKLDHKFTIDFYEENLGRSHQMRFGAYALYALEEST